jgi:drug/metabolite transporter (DMT)-like permease
MNYILLSILSSASIFIVFKLINKRELSLPHTITINYLIAFTIGWFANTNNPVKAISEPWIIWALLIGILFIIFFFVIGVSSKIAGIAITTVASKMSVIIPIAFSILFFNESVTIYKISGILLALLGVLFTVYKPTEHNQKFDPSTLWLPLFLFVGMGFIDSLIKYTQDIYITAEKSAFFSSTLFGIAFLSGLVYTFFSPKTLKQYFHWPTLGFGILLGIVNYGSIYFLINALNLAPIDDSLIFGTNNVGIVVLSVLSGLFIFKEKISSINIIGIILSILAIATMSFSG